jgi:hypothetical protein
MYTKQHRLEMGVGGRLRTLAGLFSRKRFPVLTGYQAEWAAKSVYTPSVAGRERECIM